MELHYTRRLQIELRDDEIETLKEVIRSLGVDCPYDAEPDATYPVPALSTTNQ